MKSWVWKEIEESIRERLPCKLFVGLEDPELKGYLEDGRDFLYVDNAYFHRGARSTKFRLIRKHVHLTNVLDRPADRVTVTPRPWKTGRNVVVIPPSPWYVKIFGCGSWLDETVSRLKASTDRPIQVKYLKSEPLADYLADAWAVVTYGSVAGVEAALHGVPVFSGPICPSLPISSGAVENIETPKYPDRGPWIRSLSYATWDQREIDSINFEDYDYSRRHHL